MNDTNKANATIARIIVMVVLLVIILAGGFFAVNAITGGAQHVTLPSANPIVGQATQPIIDNSGSKATTDVSGYSMKDVVYFDNNAWLVGTLTKQNDSANDTIVVMQKINGFYQDVLGPGTSFAASDVQGLPADVSYYLTNKGYTYNAE